MLFIIRNNLSFQVNFNLFPLSKIFFRSPTLFKIVFFIIAAAELTSHLTDSPLLHYFSKPLIMIWLSVYFAYYARTGYNRFAFFIQAGFFFSWLGDVFLMFDDGTEMFFMLGLSSFLFTHIFYILAFLNSIKGKKPFLKKNWYFAIPFAAAGIINVVLLFPVLGMLTGPVAFYGAAIITMVICALNRKGAVSSGSFLMVFSGAVLFLISDSLISTNKFMMEIPMAEFFIMSLYISAQYLIMRGSLSQLETSG